MLKMTEREYAILKAIGSWQRLADGYVFTLDALIELLYPAGARRPRACRATVQAGLRGMLYKMERCGMRLVRTSPMGRGNSAEYILHCTEQTLKECVAGRKWVQRRHEMA